MPKLAVRSASRIGGFSARMRKTRITRRCATCADTKSWARLGVGEVVVELAADESFLAKGARRCFQHKAVEEEHHFEDGQRRNGSQGRERGHFQERDRC